MDLLDTTWKYVQGVKILMENGVKNPEWDQCLGSATELLNMHSNLKTLSIQQQHKLISMFLENFQDKDLADMGAHYIRERIPFTQTKDL